MVVRKKRRLVRSTICRWRRCGADQLTLVGRLEDNEFAGFSFRSTSSIITVGFNSDPIDDLSIRRNRLRANRIVTDPIQANALIMIRSTNHPIRNITVSDNEIVECGGTAVGEAKIAGIRIVGPHPLTGIIGPNRIDNGATGSVDIGVRIDSSVPQDNGLVINGHSISRTVPTRYWFETLPFANRV